jgi:ubiquinone/menaquinone biosynthesis C-methylase UbiE
MLNNKTSWWNRNLSNEDALRTFKSWVGGTDAGAIAHIQNRHYQSVLDVGCGMGLLGVALMKDDSTLFYVGLDSCSLLIKQIKQKQNLNVVTGDCEFLPIASDSFNMIYFRHVLEHLPDFKNALAESIRVANREVVVDFYLRPEYFGRPFYDRENEIFNNVYSAREISQFLDCDVKVKNVYWGCNGYRLHVLV